MKEAVADLVGPLKEAHKEWGWYLALGIGLIALGVYAIYAMSAATFASVVLIGAIVMVSGIFQLAAAFVARGAGHVILMLLVGALDVFVGLMLVEHPGLGALVLTFFLAVLFVFSGLYRFVAALWLQFPYYGWVAFSGLVTFALGILLWMQWPISAFWFIGFAVGVNLIFAGAAWSSLAIKLKSVPV
ncbi:MAG: HdeD family acid-resistance protein [Candidatus Eremiobacteraeota bacterium]|nr:HdeD family acid-resistance protein [Candidatus Eremiobacteraeota bacterium]